MKVDIPTVLLMLTITAGGIYKFANVEKDVALNTQSSKQNLSLIVEMKEDRKDMVDMLLARFDRTDDKIDRMIQIIHKYQTNQ